MSPSWNYTASTPTSNFTLLLEVWDANNVFLDSEQLLVQVSSFGSCQGSDREGHRRGATDAPSASILRHSVRVVEDRSATLATSGIDWTALLGDAKRAAIDVGLAPPLRLQALTTPAPHALPNNTLASLRDDVLRANLHLSRSGLALYTFGNASAIDRATGLVVIKPSGVPYEEMRAEDLVVTDLEGRIVEGTLRPSSDLPTHLVLYRAFPAIGGVVHTHSHYATVWAQAGREIPCMGTTHADYFRGPVPITDPLEAAEIASEYEANTGHAIVRRFRDLDPTEMPATLVAGHASFCWGATVQDAVHTAALLETVAHMAYDTASINPTASPISQHLLDKHFLRKHGSHAYYGQP